MSTSRTSNGNWRDELEALDLGQSTIDMTWSPELRALFKTTILTEGIGPQVLTAAEEAGEYNKACIRIVSRPWQPDENFHRLVDETADLRIMLAQMEHVIAEIGPANWPETLQERIRFKADRLRQRILAAHAIKTEG